ncbi:MAG: hypothetical protein ACHQNV_09835 [Vicinamibacteria bacterium]
MADRVIEGIGRGGGSRSTKGEVQTHDGRSREERCTPNATHLEPSRALLHCEHATGARPKA